jgi:hypothetical protein
MSGSFFLGGSGLPLGLFLQLLSEIWVRTPAVVKVNCTVEVLVFIFLGNPMKAFDKGQFIEQNPQVAKALEARAQRFSKEVLTKQLNRQQHSQP